MLRLPPLQGYPCWAVTRLKPGLSSQDPPGRVPDGLSAIASAPDGADESGDIALPAGQTIAPRQIDRHKSPADKSIIQRVVNQNACEVEVGIGEPATLGKEIRCSF